MVKLCKTTSLLYFLLFSLSLAMFGCSDPQSQKEDSQIHEKKDQDKELIISENKPVIDENVTVDEPPSTDDRSKELDSAVTKLAIGQSAAYVQEMFGKKYELVNSADTNTVIWRFDITKNTDYKFVPTGTTLQKMNVDVVDYDSLRQGIIDAQLFIEFDEKDKISTFSYYYKASDDVITVRHTFEDGTVKEEKI
ncbi:hypothetical protein [Brevibacillus sp. NRS-1366]|uniref:hypothetical protein n=1 Tax=Brevibacillus sp. NRS-1366 TaxID=3233899 RepID=UPI003D1EF159